MSMRSLLASLIVAATIAPACSQTPVVVPLRSMERPRDVDFICLKQMANGTWEGQPLETCALNPDDTPNKAGARLFSLVTQTSRGELAVVDIGSKRDDSAVLVKVDPRVPGYSFIPVGAAPTDVVADPLGTVVFVSSGRDPRIDVLPSGLLHGPIDSTAAVDPPPWPHIDFDRATEGMPSAMSIVRNGESRRLYVTLPDAIPTAKIAVFDLAKPPVAGEAPKPTIPGRVGDIVLGAPDAQPLPWAPIACGPKGNATTWWSVYDTCKGEKPKVPIGVTSVDPKGLKFHLAGVAAIGNTLFVADDRAPVIHVYDAAGGLEIRRIAIGAPTSRLAVSPVVPDEVTIQNSTAIDVCMSRGWLGDGKDHSTESKSVADQLKGRCRAHRYIYAIDLVDNESTSGSLVVVDVPVITQPAERLDIDAAELVQPMACDSPSFAARRIPLGPFGLNGTNVVPARSIAFVQLDPAISNIDVKAARCRGWDAAHPLKNLDLDPADGVPARSGRQAQARRRAVAHARGSEVDARRLRVGRAVERRDRRRRRRRLRRDLPRSQQRRQARQPFPPPRRDALRARAPRPLDAAARVLPAHRASTPPALAAHVDSGCCAGDDALVAQPLRHSSEQRSDHRHGRDQPAPRGPRPTGCRRHATDVVAAVPRQSLRVLHGGLGRHLRGRIARLQRRVRRSARRRWASRLQGSRRWLLSKGRRERR
jgi:hypothetical protein